MSLRLTAQLKSFCWDLLRHGYARSFLCAVVIYTARETCKSRSEPTNWLRKQVTDKQAGHRSRARVLMPCNRACNCWIALLPPGMHGEPTQTFVTPSWLIPILDTFLQVAPWTAWSASKNGMLLSDLLFALVQDNLSECPQCYQQGLWTFKQCTVCKSKNGSWCALKLLTVTTFSPLKILRPLFQCLSDFIIAQEMPKASNVGFTFPSKQSGRLLWML